MINTYYCIVHKEEEGKKQTNKQTKNKQTKNTKHKTPVKLTVNFFHSSKYKLVTIVQNQFVPLYPNIINLLKYSII